MALIEFLATALATILATLVLLPALILAIQVAAAIWRRTPPLTLGEERPSVAILVPAHDEALGIGATLDAIRTELIPGDRLLVVADNCSDGTADIARARGAEVLERHDLSRRGKGYALDFGVRHLMAEPPGVVAIIDADTAISPGTLDILARQCAATGQPVQVLDLMRAPPGAGLKARLAEFAWIVRNRVRPLGFHHLGLPCQLMGTGMAFPWHLLANAPLASGHLVEDMQLGLDLARAGKPPLFCPAGLVVSHFPATADGLKAQRTRWEHGHLGVILGEVPCILLSALVQRDWPRLAMGLDLAVPPLTLLALLIFAAVGLGTGLFLAGGSAQALLLAALAAALFTFSVSASWRHFGREAVALNDLPAALSYVLWKIPLYLRFVVGRQVEWVRSKRDQP